MSLIKPTVGRVVLFMAGAAVLPGFAKPSEGEPCAALVARVWSDRCVNLSVFDANGVPFHFTSVKLLQEDDVAPEGLMHAKWMDYQKGQAAKAEQLEAKLAEPVVGGTPITDADIERVIVAAGKTAPRITPTQIEKLMQRVDYKLAVRQADDTSTFVHAYLDGRFFLASGHSACVDPANFDADIGFKIAMGKAQAAARDELWKLEGYRLFQQLAAA
jgi:hypothetical protein